MSNKLRVLVACEYSGTVRDAFIALEQSELVDLRNARGKKTNQS